MRFRALAAAAVFLFLPLAACAADTGYREGDDYRTINPAMNVEVAPGKVQVLELFWYTCPHCFHMEPELNAWLKKQQRLEFVRVPAVFAATQPDGKPNIPYLHAKAFYAAQVLGVGEKIHTPLFEAIHVHNRTLRTEDELARFFAEQGVADKEFRSAFSSFAVDTKVKQAMKLTAGAGITGVPALIVNGKYHVVARYATSYDEYLAIADYLIARAREAR